ncbi:MAG: Flp family type IVb pilin [Actinomycetota bacterium]
MIPSESNPFTPSFGGSAVLAIHALLNWLRQQDEQQNDRGASLVEYALMVALIAVVCAAAVTALGTTTSEQYSEITSLLD